MTCLTPEAFLTAHTVRVGSCCPRRRSSYSPWRSELRLVQGIPLSAGAVPRFRWQVHICSLWDDSYPNQSTMQIDDALCPMTPSRDTPDTNPGCRRRTGADRCRSGDGCCCTDGQRLRLRAAQRRQEYAGEDGDDYDHHQQRSGEAAAVGGGKAWEQSTGPLPEHKRGIEFTVGMRVLGRAPCLFVVQPSG